MDFCTPHFGKSIKNVVFQDVESFFKTERTENDILEFKSINGNEPFDSQLRNIKEAVCAFLNSSGGLLIWGCPRGIKANGQKEKVYKGDITWFTEILEKDALVSKISDSIIPLPSGIRLEIKSCEKGCVVLIEVDTSEYAPHQFNNIYNMRIDGQNKPAPHHYIEALFKKIKYPSLECYMKIKGVNAGSDTFEIQMAVVFFNLSPLINDECLHFRMVVSNGIFKDSLTADNSNYALQGHEYFKQNARNNFHFGEPVVEDPVLVFNKDVIRDPSRKCQIIINFGGKHSPLKTCVYTLFLPPNISNNLDKIITSRIENRLIKDVQDEKGLTREQLIKITLEAV